ncbi:battenin isoform X2 [Anabrus simplex]
MSNSTEMPEEHSVQFAMNSMSPLSPELTEHSSLRDVGGQRCWRNLIAFWLLGLCNNYGYVVMLSAAHDVLSTETNYTEGQNTTHTVKNSTRDCNPLSTGAILLADILPSLLVKLVAPFLPLFVHFRLLAVILLSCCGFLLVALSTVEWITILGVVATSIASGLGELTILAYSSGFDREAISMWSSGTGGAGIFGAGSYAGLTALGLSPSQSLLIMLVVPVVMGVSFWCILQHPNQTLLLWCEAEVSVETRDETGGEDGANSSEIKYTRILWEKLCDIPPLLKYMIPLTAVYLFEYFINQGLFELVYYPNIWIDHKEQYRWLQLDYQIGVFISRSSASFITIQKIWLLALLQFVNVLLFVFEVLYFYIPSIWVVFVIVLWEGTLGGAAYVNTYYRISKEVLPAKREFSLSITTIADAVGIGIAGVLAIPVHNIICDLPRNIS